MELMFGNETEYAFYFLGTRGSPRLLEMYLPQFMDFASSRLRHLPDVMARGFFLQNGSRFYLDHGLHPEISTPECTNPWDGVRYTLAGDAILSKLGKEFCSTCDPGAQVLILKNNVDYSGERTTWGSHESFLHKARPDHLPPQLIPHLVSRIIYCGAGGFNPFSASLSFVLAPRAFHLQTAISPDSTQNRGIFHTKDEPLSSGGYHRLHCISGESLCSHTASWLRIATTALVVALAAAEIRPGDDVELVDPLAAMRNFASDPGLKALVAGGPKGQLSALEIQRHYLSLAEAHIGAPFFPSWAKEACQHWRATLDMLEGSPERAALTLDWAIKQSLFKRLVDRRGFQWEDLGKQTKKRTAEFEALRHDLLELDVRFSQLGDGGLFADLDRDDLLTHEFVGVDNIEHAMENPPASGRARVRGECVRRLAGDADNYLCDWHTVWERATNRMLDLSDPFCTEERWREGPAVLTGLEEFERRMHLSGRIRYPSPGTGRGG